MQPTPVSAERLQAPGPAIWLQLPARQQGLVIWL
jgi:hypothetical protein